MKMDLALNNQQRLICHKPNQPTNFKALKDSNKNENILVQKACSESIEKL